MHPGKMLGTLQKKPARLEQTMKYYPAVDIFNALVLLS